MIVQTSRSAVPKRLLAVLGAAAMVGGSIAVRAVVLDDENGNDGGRGNGGRSRLVCATELEAACRNLANANHDLVVVVEPAGTTAAALVAAVESADVEFDGWLTIAPWPKIVRDKRTSAGMDDVLGRDSQVLARSPLAIAMRSDRATTLAEHCDGGAVGWRCLGDAAGTQWTDVGGSEQWGAVKPVHADPTVDATALLVLGEAIGHFLASPDLAVDDVSRLDWETNDEFAGWFQRLEDAVPDEAFAPDADALERWLQTGLVAYDAVAGTEAELTAGLAAAAPDLRVGTRLLYPAPVGTADVVYVSVGTSTDIADIADIATARETREALAAAAFRVDPAEAPPGAPADAPGALPDTDGLPSAGALDALRTLWERVVR